MKPGKKKPVSPVIETILAFCQSGLDKDERRSGSDVTFRSTKRIVPDESTPIAPCGWISRVLRDVLWTKGPTYIVFSIGAEAAMVKCCGNPRSSFFCQVVLRNKQ